MTLSEICADLRADEGWRDHVYDDATGKPIAAGSEVKGHPSIGYGFNLEKFTGTPLPQRVADLWLETLVEHRWLELLSKEPWIEAQPDDVQRALGNMAYQMGVEGVRGFTLMLAALKRGDRETAALNVIDSKYHRQTPARAERVATLIRGY